jgi:hypothetical protein
LIWKKRRFGTFFFNFPIDSEIEGLVISLKKECDGFCGGVALSSAGEAGCFASRNNPALSTNVNIIGTVRNGAGFLRRLLSGWIGNKKARGIRRGVIHRHRHRRLLTYHLSDHPPLHTNTVRDMLTRKLMPSRSSLCGADH